MPSALWLVPAHKRRHLPTPAPVGRRRTHVGQAPTSVYGIEVYPIAGVARNICAGYGPRPKPDGTTSLHDACDLCAPQGSAAVAVTDGIVSYGTDPFGGNVAILRTTDGSMGYYYAHLLDVQTGQLAVTTGQQIGRVDTTGNAAKVGISHTHFQVWPGGQFQQGTVHPDPTADLMAAPILDEPVGAPVSWWKGALAAAGAMAATAGAILLATHYEVI